MMNYRLLPSEEWDRLRPFVPEGCLPSPQAATVAVAEDDTGEIQGLLFLQIQLHMEPILIRHPAVNFTRLQRLLENAISGNPGLVYYAFTDDPHVSRMAEIVGMTPLSYRVYKKEVS